MHLLSVFIQALGMQGLGGWTRSTLAITWFYFSNAYYLTEVARNCYRDKKMLRRICFTVSALGSALPCLWQSWTFILQA
ncbi:hypothetical protein BJ170DRAFT_602362 [Xylariales sp. AK1849]|nr:hypothetical protein BJ170DRAFT_602362 [Xylariales sp. AK1849]